jgi:SAM-dependent methyltransferase
VEATLEGTSLARAQIQALRMAEGYFGSQILFSANELGVFDELASGPATTEGLASHLAVDTDALERLLNAAVVTGLLEKSGDTYSNSAMVDAVLVSGRTGYMGNWMRLMSRWMRIWVDLTTVVRTGEPQHDASIHLGGDPDFTKDFILAMHDYATLRGREIARYLDFSDARALLDLGGGPATYSILFAERWPDLTVTMFDLPGVLPIAERNVRSAGVDDRVSLVAGDYHHDPIGEGFDVIFISDVLHQEDADTCRAILRKAYSALRPGGQLVVQGMFLDEDHTSPRWPVMHSLILLQFYGGGRAYTVGETIGFAEEAGFEGCSLERMSLLNVNSLILGKKP